MRIGILLPQIAKGGAERAATRISKILAENHEIYIIVFAQECPIAYDFAGKLISLKVPSSKGILNKFISSVKRIKKLKRLKKDLNLDVVISFMQSPNYVNAKSKIASCKTITSIRNFIFVEKKQDTFSKLELQTTKTIIKNSDKIICVSRELRDSIYDNFSNIKNITKKIVVLYNPYNVDEIMHLSNDDKKCKFYYNKNVIKFCTIGRIMHQKGYWNLIKSFYLLNKKYNNTMLFIIGRKEDNSKINDLINKLNLKDKVILLGQMDNPFKVISKCDVYVLSSLFEGFPNALVEAMICGLPVIASNCQSGPKEILDDVSELNINGVYKAKYGILYENYPNFEEDYSPDITKEHQVLADAMELLYKNKDLRDYYKKQSIERAKVFNYDTTRDKLEKILNS